MANKTTEQRLQSLFNQASGGTGGAGGSDAVTDAFGVAASRPDETRAASTFDASSENSVGQSYHGDSASSSSSSSQSGGAGSSIASLAEGFFGGALGLVPLIGGIAGLFGGGSQPQPTFEKYQMPSSLSFEAADTGNGLADADYGQMGVPRLYGDASTSAATTTSSAPAASPATQASNSGASAASTATSSSGTPQISVNVQAMDAQSFMSYSGEIAKAVRDAMLNLSSINDVVTEL